MPPKLICILLTTRALTSAAVALAISPQSFDALGGSNNHMTKAHMTKADFDWAFAEIGANSVQQPPLSDADRATLRNAAMLRIGSAP